MGSYVGSCRIRSESFCRPYLHSTAALQNDLPLDMSKISKSKPLRIQAPHTTWPCNVSSRCIRRLKDVTIRGAVVPIPMSCESLRSSHGSFSGTGGVRFKSEQSSPAPSTITDHHSCPDCEFSSWTVTISIVWKLKCKISKPPKFTGLCILQTWNTK